MLSILLLLSLLSCATTPTEEPNTPVVPETSASAPEEEPADVSCTYDWIHPSVIPYDGEAKQPVFKILQSPEQWQTCKEEYLAYMENEVREFREYDQTTFDAVLPQWMDFFAHAIKVFAKDASLFEENNLILLGMYRDANAMSEFTFNQDELGKLQILVQQIGGDVSFGTEGGGFYSTPVVLVDKDLGISSADDIVVLVNLNEERLLRAQQPF